MSITFTHLRSLGVEELVHQAREAGLDNAGNLRHSELIFELMRLLTDGGQPLIGEGVLEILSDGFGFLRSPVSAFAPGADDIYVSPSQIRRFNLRSGDWIVGKSRAPREGERYFALLQIQKVNGNAPEIERNRLLFDTLSPVSSNNSITISGISEQPICFGDMGVIEVASAQQLLGSSSLGLHIAKEFGADETIFLGIGTRPDKFHTLRELTSENSFLTHFGDLPSRHVQQSQLAVQRAQRLAEQGKSVALIIDSLCLLANAYRDEAEQQGRQGAISLAIGNIKSIFGVARKIEQGGSLTIFGLMHPVSSSLRERLVMDLFPYLNFLFHNDGPT